MFIKTSQAVQDIKFAITSWYHEKRGMIPKLPITNGLVCTPIDLQASSNLLSFSKEST